MRFSLLYICMAISLLSCHRGEDSPRTGDLIFQAGIITDMSEAIADATEQRSSAHTPAAAGRQITYTHVGIVVASPDLQVLEATEVGVRYTPFDDFLGKAAQIDGRPLVAVMRLRDTTGVAAAVRRATRYLGQPYDYSFLPDNGKIYCSELVWESYRDAEGNPRFTARPMNFRAADGTMPLFWQELFGQLGEPIPEGVPGTNPNDMAQEPILREVCRYY